MRKLMKRKKKKNSQKNGSTMFQENVRRKETGEEESAAATAAMWDLGSPLFDSHEVVSVSHLIDRHLMALPSSLGDGGSKQLSRKFSSATSGRSQAVVVPAPLSPTRSTGGRDNDETIAVAGGGGGGGSSEDRRTMVGGMLGFVGKKLRKRNEKKRKKKISRSGKEGKQQRSAKAAQHNDDMNRFEFDCHLLRVSLPTRFPLVLAFCKSGTNQLLALVSRRYRLQLASSSSMDC
ncbi:unnamed protein product [Linum tenue]|uniref:Uncharacterized protein n=1 Tax=Linum tenue TaxID=586396 RepID=A0AAV0QND7_9ROSI|nr:unnamed protein product [Linum tenue]